MIKKIQGVYKIIPPTLPLIRVPNTKLKKSQPFLINGIKNNLLKFIKL